GEWCGARLDGGYGPETAMRGHYPKRLTRTLCCREAHTTATNRLETRRSAAALGLRTVRGTGPLFLMPAIMYQYGNPNRHPLATHHGQSAAVWVSPMDSVCRASPGLASGWSYNDVVRDFGH